MCVVLCWCEQLPVGADEAVPLPRAPRPLRPAVGGGDQKLAEAPALNAEQLRALSGPPQIPHAQLSVLQSPNDSELAINAIPGSSTIFVLSERSRAQG